MARHGLQKANHHGPNQPPTSCHTTGEIQPDTTNQLINATENHLLLRVFTGVPLWYTMLRWGSFASFVIFICVFIICAKVRDKHAKRKRRRRRGGLGSEEGRSLQVKSAP
ncbi:hypothetical protein F7725_001404 [Dissostichus mawsoni]|uniref:Uncharacterized protein n=1 Tax=Dissostichus mawsoni TaxID=36200 RepID=A0A7J5ZJL7_DISMA|nr:hypothetical protein F7725_001404 [Dissostichus mawsoni]